MFRSHRFWLLLVLFYSAAITSGIFTGSWKSAFVAIGFATVFQVLWAVNFKWHPDAKLLTILLTALLPLAVILFYALDPLTGNHLADPRVYKGMMIAEAVFAFLLLVEVIGPKRPPGFPMQL